VTAVALIVAAFLGGALKLPEAEPRND
jgi:hypothetical protein